MWTIELSESAKRHLADLDKTERRRILKFINDRVARLDNPRSIGEALKGPLGELWKYRVGDHRIFASIEDMAVRILIVKVGNRKEVYR